MGKLRRKRRKLHLPAAGAVKPAEKQENKEFSAQELTLMPPAEDVFKGIKIDCDNLNKYVLYDAISVKSASPAKLSKKDKLKLRREALLRKIYAFAPTKRKQKPKKSAVVGDLNPLLDALPSLESLLKSSGSKTANSPKVRGIEKASKRKKQLVQGVRLMKKVMANENFQKNPREAIAAQVKAFVDDSRLKNK